MALSVVYFQFTHCLGRPDEYLYSVMEEVEIRVPECVVWDDDDERGKVKPGAGS